jgi:hypothetical protein
VTLIENKENLGYTGGNNTAMRYAMQHSADYVWLLNNDTTIETDTLSKLVFTAEESNDIGLVSPVSYSYDEPERVEICGRYMDWTNFKIPKLHNFQDIELWEREHKGCQIILWGTALLIKKDIVGKIGYLDDTFFAYWEDTDYSIRSLNAGYRNLVCVSAKIYHKIPFHGATKQGSHFFYYMTRNQYLFFSKHFKNLGRLALLRNCLLYIIRALTACNRSNDNKGADACLDGAWAAMRGIGGPWNKDVKMPGWLRKIFHSLFSRHPYFWASLLRGEFLNIASEGLKRTKAKILRIVA